MSSVVLAVRAPMDRAGNVYQTSINHSGLGQLWNSLCVTLCPSESFVCTCFLTQKTKTNRGPVLWRFFGELLKMHGQKQRTVSAAALQVLVSDSLHLSSSFSTILPRQFLQRKETGISLALLFAREYLQAVLQFCRVRWLSTIKAKF